MSSNKRIARNLIVSILGEGVGALLNIYIIVLIARTLGPVGFGEFAFILAFVGLLQLITDLGITNLLVREVAQNPDKYREIVGNARVLAWLLTLIVIIPTAVICLFVLADKGFGLTLLVMTVAAMAVMHAVIYGALFRAFERMEFNAGFFVLHKVILLGLVFYWMNTDTSLLQLCYFYLLANLCQFLMFYIASWKVFERISWKIDLVYWKYLIWEAIPVGISMLFRKATLHVDTLLLSAFASPVALGLFSAAYRIIQIVEMLPFTLSIPMYPKMARLALDSRDEFEVFLNQVIKFYILISLPVMAYLIVFSEQIIGLMFSTEFSESTPILQALSVAVFFIFPSSIMIYVYTALNKQRLFTVISAAVLATNAGLDMWLIPDFGAFGAAVGTVAAEALFVVVSVIFLQNQGIFVDLIKLSYKPFFAATVAGLGVNQLFSLDGLFQWVAGSLSFFLIYVAVILLTKALDANEIAFVRGLLNRKSSESEAALDPELEPGAAN